MYCGVGYSGQCKNLIRDGQDAGEMLLDIEARIGELLPSREEVRASQNQGLKQKRILPDGMDWKRSSASRAIKENPAIVAKIKAQAREENAPEPDR